MVPGEFDGALDLRLYLKFRSVHKDGFFGSQQNTILLGAGLAHFEMIFHEAPPG
jgi:hypothetical protein